MRAPSSRKCRLDLAPPLADRFISGITPSIRARYYSAGPSDSILRYSLDGHPALRSTTSSGFRSVLAVSSFRFRARLDVSKPSAFSSQRGITPAFGYGAPHPSARGTLTLLNNVLLSTHYDPIRFRRFACRVLGPNHAHADQVLLRKALKYYLDVSFAEFKATRHLFPTPEGYGRTYALARLVNIRLGSHLRNKNLVVGDRPVNFPPIRDASWLDSVQYNASLRQP